MKIHEQSSSYHPEKQRVDPQQGWIDVKTEMPEKTGWYLTYSENSGVQTELYEFKETKFLFGEDITHWMNLPPNPTTND